MCSWCQGMRIKIIILLSCSIFVFSSANPTIAKSTDADELMNNAFYLNNTVETLRDTCSPSFDDSCSTNDECCRPHLVCIEQKCKCDMDYWWDKYKHVCKSRILDPIIVIFLTVGLIGFSFGFIVLAVFWREKYCPDQQQTCCNLWLQKHCCKGQDLSTPSMRAPRPPQRQPPIRRPPPSLVRGPPPPSPNVVERGAVPSLGEDLPPNYEHLSQPPEYSPPEAPPEYGDVMNAQDDYNFRSSRDPILP